MYWAFLLRYLEQGTLYEGASHHIREGDTGPGWWEWYDCSFVHETPLSVLLCPSDGLGGTAIKVPSLTSLTVAKGNYQAFFSGDSFGDIWADHQGTLDSRRRAAFGYNRGARSAEITDGTSHTMLVAEYLTGTTEDLRGIFWNMQPSAAAIFTYVTPNSSAPDILVGWTDDFCPPDGNLPELNLPCIKSVGYDDMTATSRSRHPGGVNAVFADGSVHFMTETISLVTWRNLAAIADDDVLGDY